MDGVTRGRSDGSIWKCVPNMGGAVTGPRNDVLPIRRVSVRLERLGMPLERLAGCSTSLSNPVSNGMIIRSGDDVAPIGRVRNGRHQVSVPLKRIDNRRTNVGIPHWTGAL